jgi:hypothetical protein
MDIAWKTVDLRNLRFASRPGDGGEMLVLETLHAEYHHLHDGDGASCPSIVHTINLIKDWGVLTGLGGTCIEACPLLLHGSG